MGSFPHAQIPMLFQGDEQAAAFMEDVRGILAALQILGAGVIWRAGEGSPEGVLSARVGSLYTRTDGGAGTTLYVKESGSGSTGWQAK